MATDLEVAAPQTHNELEHKRSPTIKDEEAGGEYDGWNGPDDPDNPWNKSLSYKSVQIGVVAYLTFLSPFGSTIVAPASEQILADFHVSSETVGSFITSIYLLGYVFGPLVLAPLSEIYGRQHVYNASNVGYFIFNVACAVSPNIGAVLAFRFLTGVFGATAITLGSASIGDLFIPENRGTAFAGYAFGSLFGPVLGPVVGGFLIAAKGWRWAFWLLSILSGVGAVLGLIFLRETYHHIILRRRAERDPSKNDFAAPKKSDYRYLRDSAIRPLKMMILYPVTTCLVLYSAIIYGWLYLCFTTYPSVFQQNYRFSASITGLVYLGFGIGCLISIVFSGAVSDRMYKALGKKQGKSVPEHRLPLLVFGGIWVPIGLLWYGWSAEAETQFMVPIIGTGFFGFGFVPLFIATSTYLVDAFPQYSASANAVNTVIRSLFGALLPLAGPSLYKALGIGWGNTLMACITLVMLPLSFVLYRYGARLRSFKAWDGKL